MITRKRTIGLLLTVCLLTVGVASVYAKGGNPFNELLTHILNTDAHVEELENKIAELEDLIESIPELIHDSGWLAIDPDQLLEICALDDLNIFVYMVGRHPREWNWELHQAFLGGDKYHTYEEQYIGAYWRVSGKNDTLYVYRQGLDQYWEEVRVLVWQLPS